MRRYIHFMVHVGAAAGGLYCARLLYDSMTAWEALVFLITTALPLLDEMLYAALHYAENEVARHTTNLFLVGETQQFLLALHNRRLFFTERVLHNVFVYSGLWLIWFAALSYNHAVVFFALSGILTHLLVDLVNDQHDFNSVTHWAWPVTYGFRAFVHA